MRSNQPYSKRNTATSERIDYPPLTIVEALKQKCLGVFLFYGSNRFYPIENVKVLNPERGLSVSGCLNNSALFTSSTVFLSRPSGSMFLSKI